MIAAAAAETPPPVGSGLLGVAGLKGGQPLHIVADSGIEWSQGDKSYVARGNAVATRGNVTLHADSITAWYRDAVAKPGTTEIWRIVAAGNVHIATPTQTVTGEQATYDLDQELVLITGHNLMLTTPQDVVTARDSLEWYDQKQIAVARGDATARRGMRRLKGDVLTAHVVTEQGKPARVARVDAIGHVLVSGPDQIGTSDSGVYNADSGIATLRGHVTLVRGQSALTGEYGVVDLKNGVSRLLPGNGQGGRVEGYIVPPQKGHSAE